MNSALEDLVATVQALWPGADVRVTDTQAARNPVGAQANSWFLVPNRSTPRLLVPADQRMAGARSLWRFSSALTPKEVILRTAGAAAVAARLPRAVPDLLVASSPGADSITTHLAAVLGHGVSVSLSIGTARANRKPVLEIFDEQGRSIAFAKVGSTAVAADRVRAEAQALRRLAEVRLGNLVVPRLLHFGDWGDVPVVVMSTVPTGPAQRPGGAWRIPHAAMSTLSVAFGRTMVPLPELPGWERQTRIVARLRIDEHRERLASALTRVVDRAQMPQLAGAWHGDWTPWNMARSAGRISLWDWERFEEGVPAGLDRVHFAVNTMTETHGLGVQQVREGLEWAARATRSAAPGPDLPGLVYLSLIATRYLASVEEPGGDLIRERALVMLATLEELSAK